MPSLEAHAAARKFLLDRIDYERMRVMPYGVAEFRLARMRQLLMRLGNPHKNLPAVHVAGTKGKGSTAAALAAVLTAAGYRTGLFTSPHLERVEERIMIDGLSSPPGQFANLLGDIRPVIMEMDREAARRGGGQIGPTYFEILTAAAFVLFARAGIDLAVLEVGLGGRLDATSVCRPAVSVVTSISFDHTRQLGNTLAAIAGEKAAIAKRGVPLVSGVTADEPRAVIRQVCRRRRCRLLEQGVDFDFDYRPPQHLEQADAAGAMDFRWRTRKPAAAAEGYRDLRLGLVGRHQAANMAVALAAVGQLQQAGWDIPEEAIRRGLAGLAWPARVEVAARRPAVVLDDAHNAASVAALIATLGESFSPRRRLLIFASTQEKDLRGMLAQLLGQFDEVMLTRYLDSPRAVPPEELQAIARELTGREYPVFADPAAAWEAARWAAARGPCLHHRLAVHCGRDAASTCRAAPGPRPLNSALAPPPPLCEDTASRAALAEPVARAAFPRRRGAWSMSAPVGIATPAGHARPDASSPPARAKLWTAAAILSCWLAAAAMFCAGPARIGFLSDDFDLIARAGSTPWLRLEGHHYSPVIAALFKLTAQGVFGAATWHLLALAAHGVNILLVWLILVHGLRIARPYAWVATMLFALGAPGFEAIAWAASLGYVLVESTLLAAVYLSLVARGPRGEALVRWARSCCNWPPWPSGIGGPCCCRSWPPAAGFDFLNRRDDSAGRMGSARATAGINPAARLGIGAGEANWPSWRRSSGRRPSPGSPCWRQNSASATPRATTDRSTWSARLITSSRRPSGVCIPTVRRPFIGLPPEAPPPWRWRPFWRPVRAATRESSCSGASFSSANSPTSSSPGRRRAIITSVRPSSLPRWCWRWRAGVGEPWKVGLLAALLRPSCLLGPPACRLILAAPTGSRRPSIAPSRR